MKKLTITALMLALGHFTGYSAFADDLVFTGFGSFTNDSVLLQGPLAYAVATGSALAVTGVGPQGITFQADPLNANADVTFSTSSPPSMKARDILFRRRIPAMSASTRS